jgi:hypothetical protein
VLQSGTGLDSLTLTFADEACALLGMNSDAVSMWETALAGRPGDFDFSFRHILALIRAGSLSSAHVKALALYKSNPDHSELLEWAAVINHMKASDEMLAGKLPILGQPGVATEDIASSPGGLCLSMAVAQLDRATPKDVTAAAASDASAPSEEVKEAEPVPPATLAGTLLHVHTLRRLGKFQEALGLLEEMGRRHDDTVRTAAVEQAKQLEKRITDQLDKDEAEAEALAKETAEAKVGLKKEGLPEQADQLVADKAAPKKVDRALLSAQIENAALAYARRRRLPLTVRRAEAIDLKCAQGDWVGGYTDTVRQLREQPGDVKLLMSAVHCALMALSSDKESSSDSKVPAGLEALTHAVESDDPAAFATDVEVEKEAVETESKYVDEMLRRAAVMQAEQQQRALRNYAIQLNDETTRVVAEAQMKASLEEQEDVAEKLAAIEVSSVPAPSIAHLRGVLVANQQVMVRATQEVIAQRRKAIAQAQREAAAAAAAEKAKQGEETIVHSVIEDEGSSSAASPSTAAADASTEASAAADELEEMPADKLANGRPITGGRTELGALLVELFLEFRILDATGGTAGSNAPLPAEVDSLPNGKGLRELEAAKDPAAFFIAQLVRCIHRFGHNTFLPREIGQFMEPFVSVEDLGLGPEADTSKLSYDNAPWHRPTIERFILSVAGDHVRAAPAPSEFGISSQVNSGEAPLRGGARSAGFRFSPLAKETLVGALKELEESNGMAEADGEALDLVVEEARIRYERDMEQYKALRERAIAASDRGDEEEAARLSKAVNETPPRITLSAATAAILEIVEVKLGYFVSAARLLRSLGVYAPARMTEEQLRARITRLAQALDHSRVLLELSRAQQEGSSEEGPAQILLMVIGRYIMDLVACLRSKSEAARAKGDEVEAARAERAAWSALHDAAFMMQLNLGTNGTGQVSLFLMQLYSQLGALSLVHDIYREFGVRSISNDSASYLLLPHAFRLGGYSEALDTCQAIIQNQKDVDRVIPAQLTNALVSGSYGSALDIHLFRRRIAHSLQLIEAQSIAGLISVPSDKFAATRDFLDAVVGPMGTGMGSDPSRFPTLLADQAARLCTDNIDRDVVLEVDPPAGPLSSVGRRLAERRYRDRVLAGVERRRLLMLALHAVSHNRVSPLVGTLPELLKVMTRLSYVRPASDTTVVDGPLADVMVAGPDGVEPYVLEGEGVDGVGLRELGTHKMPAATRWGIWSVVVRSLRAATASLRAFPAPEVPASSALMGGIVAAAMRQVTVTKGTTDASKVDFEQVKLLLNELHVLASAAPAVVDAVIDDPVLPLDPDVASSSGAGTVAGSLTSIAGWKGRALRPSFLVRCAALIGEAMAVIPLCFGAMNEHLPDPEGGASSKAKKSKVKKTKVKAKGGAKSTKPEEAEAAAADPGVAAAIEVRNALRECSQSWIKALDQLNKILGAARTAFPIGKSSLPPWDHTHSVVPDLFKPIGGSDFVGVHADVIHAIETSWSESIGRMADTLRDRMTMIRDAST